VPPMCPRFLGKLLRSRSARYKVGEPACRPGSVTTLSVSWQYSPACRLSCRFISHRFSLLPAVFGSLAELGRNWRKRCPTAR
jgi:hypothetical protein